MDASAVRVSILIPNFNNGVASSRDGKTDLIGDLLQSLHDTLADDPTPLEIIAYDDGSTDDSLDTLRTAANKTWRNNQPFLELIEAEHCGILARTANVLSRRARGDILVRLDGDTQMLTPRWAEKLCAIFDHGPARLGVVGPKQLRPPPEMTIHAFGDWLLHPKGYHHIAHGLPRHACTRPIEVDHVMGCFYCCRRAVYDDLNGYDETILRGQTIDFGLRARLHGWSCWAIPQIEYIHRHGLRLDRNTRADQDQGVLETLDTFRRKWGFDRLAPDLEAVRARYLGTPLLWNAQVFGNWPTCTKEADAEPLPMQASEWTQFADVPAFRQHVEFRLNLAAQVIQQTRVPEHTAIIGCRAGLAAHLLATKGLSVVGVDTDAAKIKLARQCVKNQAYPKQRPTFKHQADPARLPLRDGEAQLVLAYDLFEHHHNPVGLLNEAYRVLEPNGLLIILTARANSADLMMLGMERRYLYRELYAQSQCLGGWQTMSDPKKDNIEQPIVLVLKKVNKAGEREAP